MTKKLLLLALAGASLFSPNSYAEGMDESLSTASEDQDSSFWDTLLKVGITSSQAVLTHNHP